MPDRRKKPDKADPKSSKNGKKPGRDERRSWRAPSRRWPPSLNEGVLADYAAARRRVKLEPRRPEYTLSVDRCTPLGSRRGRRSRTPSPTFHSRFSIRRERCDEFAAITPNDQMEQAERAKRNPRELVIRAMIPEQSQVASASKPNPPRHFQLSRIPRIECETEFDERECNPPNIVVVTPPDDKRADQSPKTWFGKSISKMLNEKTSPPSDKKRSKSPSNILELGLKFFARKSTEDEPKKKPDSSIAALMGLQEPGPSNLQDRTLSISIKQPSSSEDEDDDADKHGDMSKDASPSDQSTKTAFHFFKKDSKRIKNDPNKADTCECEADKNNCIKHKKGCDGLRKIKIKPSEPEKPPEAKKPDESKARGGKKFFSKQRSKETGERVANFVRKGSLKFGNALGLWYERDTKTKIMGMKTTSLEGAECLNEGNTLGEGGLTRMELRSRSLNNLGAIGTNVGQSKSESDIAFQRLLRNGETLKSGTYSLPNMSALNFRHNLPFPTGGSGFMRRSKILRHSNSQGSPHLYFELKVPDHLRNTIKSFNNGISKGDLTNAIYIAACDNTPMRSSLVANFPIQVDLENYIYHLAGNFATLSLDYTDSGDLAGKTVVMKEKKLKRNGFDKKHKDAKATGRFFGGSAVDDHGDFRSRSRNIMNTPGSSSERNETRSLGFLHSFLSMFGSKTDPARMERLGARLNQLAETDIPLLPTFQPFLLTKRAYEALQIVQEMQFEELFSDVTMVSENESRRQRVILEMVATEASYIGHIRTVVELFYSVAYILREEGIMADVQTSKLFINITDVLNANLVYWSTTLFPMLADALARRQGFSIQLLFDAGTNFEEIFKPYETFVYEHKNILAYSKELMENNPIYMAYLTWCESQKECNRLKLSDIMVKPMQRLTKYSLLFRKVYELTDTEPDKENLKNMYIAIHNYISDINLAIRYKEYYDLTQSVISRIESYDIFAKDEEVDSLVRYYTDMNMSKSMVGCDKRIGRMLMMKGDLRMKEHNEQRIDVKVLLFTDLLIICSPSKKKKSDEETYKVIRQKYPVDKLRIKSNYESKNNPEEVYSLNVVVLDETGTAVMYFTFYDTNGESKGNPSLKKWEVALTEARLVLKLARKYSKELRRKRYDTDSPSSSDSEPDKVNFVGQDVVEAAEKAAKARMNTMIFGAAIYWRSTAEGANYFGEGFLENRSLSKASNRGRSRASSRASRLSSLQHSNSSIDCLESNVGPAKRMVSADTSIDRRTISMSSEEWLTSLNHTEADFSLSSPRSKSPSQRPAIRPPVHVQNTPNTLTVESMKLLDFGQSMPELHRDHPSSALPSASNSPICLNVPKDPNRGSYLRASPTPGTLGPDTRGTSYPPPSHSRASLQRAYAFSSTKKNPLIKTRHFSREASAINPRTDKKSISTNVSQEFVSPVAEAINIHATDFTLGPMPETEDSENNGNEEETKKKPK